MSGVNDGNTNRHPPRPYSEMADESLCKVAPALNERVDENLQRVADALRRYGGNHVRRGRVFGA